MQNYSRCFVEFWVYGFWKWENILSSSSLILELWVYGFWKWENILSSSSLIPGCRVQMEVVA
jgi:hypothetical protein